MAITRRPLPKGHHDSAADRFIAGAGRKARGSGKTSIALRIDRELLARLDEAAKRRGISRTAFICFAVEKLEREEG